MANRAIILDTSDESSSGSESHDSESRSDSSEEGEGLIDDEAIDDEESDDSDGEHYEGTCFWRNDDVEPADTFHQFAKLPPELRARVWEFFCPDLTSRGRLLMFQFPQICSDSLEDHFALADQTLSLRIVSAIHQESRQLVLKKFPNTIPLEPATNSGRRGHVRFDYDRDICNIVKFGETEHRYNNRTSHQLDKIRFLAIQLDFHQGFWIQEFLEWIIRDVKGCLRCFPGTETVFLGLPHSGRPPINIRWTASDMARHARIQTFEKEPGLGEDLGWIYAWPDMVEHSTFCDYNIVPKLRENMPEELLDVIDRHGVKVVPMLEFEFEDGAMVYDRLREDFERGVPLDQDDGLAPLDEDDGDHPSEDDSDHPSQDEYESDGIDDAEIPEDDESSEDELIPRPIDALDPYDHLDRSDDSDVIVTEVGRFSSPEAEPFEEPSSGTPIVRRPKRRIVSDSEDESEGGAPVAKRARRDAPIAISSDEDGDEDGDEEGPRLPQHAGSRIRMQVISSDEESDGDEDDQPPAKLSLAEQLRQSREENPLSSNDESDSGDGLSYADSDEDEEDDEDEEGRGGGLIDDMAEDSDEDSDEDGEEEEGSDEAW